MKKVFLMAVSAAALLFAQSAKAQTNLQVFYDFGSDRQHVTTTLEGFYNDNWGNTFFFIDHDFGKNAAGKVESPSGTYFEVARCLNFWQDSAIAPLSLQVEYNGGVYNGYGINNAFLAGVDYFVHNADFSNTFNFKLLYKHITGADQNAPLQLTFVWGMQDIFGVKGLRFSGFADFWWEDHMLFSDHNGVIVPDESHTVFISEPQLWYNIGQHFGCDNLNIGGEVELSYDFGTAKGFWCRPCAGLKWVF
ncbi:MAG: DUF5020 family protein [Bacteroidales bacterium]|nr:DUF5020 family protein [Bacteroidales bacterium]